jgi:acetyl esterase/lipase
MPPPERWLDEVADVKSALGWLAAHAAEHHVDPARIAIMGGSAGGNLALLAAYSAGDSRLPPSTDVPAVTVRCVVNLYGPVEMELAYRSTNSPDYTRPQMREYLGGPPDEAPDRYRLVSPLFHVGAKTPPTITLLGTSDRLVGTEQAERLDQALVAAGIPHETWLIPATDHGFDINWGGLATQIARAKIGAFLDKHLEPR